MNTEKRQPIQWENVFANYSSHRELISSMYKKLKFTKKKTNQLKWANDLNRYFSKEAIQRPMNIKKKC